MRPYGGGGFKSNMIKVNEEHMHFSNTISNKSFFLQLFSKHFLPPPKQMVLLEQLPNNNLTGQKFF
jgi:hypothetical protein